MNELEQNTEKSVKPDFINHSARRINRISQAINAKSYLEIGVFNGITFFKVETPIKTAVDPNFRFSTENINNNSTFFHQVTSDDFFATLPLQQKFDLIFIDGLHTSEQTYRDLCNCLNHAHDRTVILIDDVKPKDVFGALRDQSKSGSYRRQAGLTGNNEWMGDVFKVVFMVHDFHLGLNYCTLQTNQLKHQTLVWRSNSDWRKPRFDSFESIDRLSYFDLIDHIDMLKICSEKDGIELCLNELPE